MARRCSSLITCAFALLTIPISACEKDPPDTQAPEHHNDDAIDQLTRDLLAALAAADRDRALALSNTAVAIELDERNLAIIGRTLTWLGPITKLAKAEEIPVTGGVERRYRVGFERDEVTLAVTVIAGKVEGFEFDEGQWQALNDRATQATAASLRVADFSFLGPQGETLTGSLAGLDGLVDRSALRYRLTLEGLDAQLREHHVIIAKSVVDGEGNEVFRQRENDDIRFPQAETGSAGGRLDGGVAVPGPGSYTLKLTITDLVGGQSITHDVPITID